MTEFSRCHRVIPDSGLAAALVELGCSPATALLVLQTGNNRLPAAVDFVRETALLSVLQVAPARHATPRHASGE
jgi:hypothetical protein